MKEGKQQPQRQGRSKSRARSSQSRMRNRQRSASSSKQPGISLEDQLQRIDDQQSQSSGNGRPSRPSRTKIKRRPSQSSRSTARSTTDDSVERLIMNSYSTIDRASQSIRMNQRSLQDQLEKSHDREYQSQSSNSGRSSRPSRSEIERGPSNSSNSVERLIMNSYSTINQAS